MDQRISSQEQKLRSLFEQFTNFQQMVKVRVIIVQSSGAFPESVIKTACFPNYVDGHEEGGAQDDRGNEPEDEDEHCVAGSHHEAQ